jgi:Zn-dependent protease
MGLLNLLIKNPAVFFMLAIPILYSIIIHELAHGWVANRLGDPTARLAGRLSLNPLKHLDPVGTLMLLFFGFGWAKPVPINLANIRNQRQGLIMVSAAGIVANIVLAFAALLGWRLISPSGSVETKMILYYTAQINIILAAFNMIPIPPLDGSKILMGFMPSRFQYSFSRLEPYGFFIIIGLLYIGALDPVIAFFRGLILWLISILLA